mgnify:FL=1|jgi:hypothetical protein
MARLTLLLLLAPACEPPPPFDTSPDCPKDSQDSTTTALPSPSVRMAFPSSSETLAYCSWFPVVIEAENFTFSADHIEEPNVDNEGHYHLYDGDVYLFTGASEWTILPTSMALTPGRHALRVELASNDHQEIGISWITEITVDDSSTDDTGALNCIGGGTGSGPIY